MQTFSHHLSLPALRARGWTAPVVARLLGGPDLLALDPRVRCAVPVRLYARTWVEAAEATPEFTAHRAAAARRSDGQGDAAHRNGAHRSDGHRRPRRPAAGRGPAERHRRAACTPDPAAGGSAPPSGSYPPNVPDRIARARITVPRLTPQVLAEQAVSHRNRRARRRAREHGAHRPVPATVAAADPAALRRWQVNYLRHVLTDYDRLLDGLYGGTGRRDAERVLRGRVYQAISAAYPALRGECRRQFAARGRG